MGPGPLLTQVVFARVGVVRGMRALGLLVAWAVWVQSHDGEAPTIAILAGESKRSRASYFRDRQCFLDAFPGEESPDRLARAVLAEMDRRKVAKRERLDEVRAMSLVLTMSAEVAA